MNWRGILSVIVIIAIVGLIAFSPKGQKYHGEYTSKYTKPLGSFISGFAAKITGNKTSETSDIGKLEIQLRNVDSSDFKDVEFDVRDKSLNFKMDYEVVNFLDTEFSFSDSLVDAKIDNFQGDVSFFPNGKMKIVGEADYLRVNGLSFNKPDTEIMFVGEPVEFYMTDVSKREISFNDVSGSLSWTGLGGVPALLTNDHLELEDFDGTIIGENGSVDIFGTVETIRLNGVEFSKV
jgi:hypothetical protein